MMDAERFETLAEAYGGAIGRWPAHEQDAAWAFIAREPRAAGALLERARDLDEALDAAPAPVVSRALRDRVLAMAPKPRRVASVRRWLTGAGVGIGFAAAAAAGVVAGVSLSAAAPPSDDALLAQLYAPADLLSLDLPDEGET